MQDEMYTRFYALVQAPMDKKRSCLKCGKSYKMKQGSRRVCKPCAVENDRMGMVASHHNICM